MWSFMKKTLKVLTLIWVMSLITFAILATFLDVSLITASVVSALGIVTGLLSLVIPVIFREVDKER